MKIMKILGKEVKIVNCSKYLSKKYGGKWKYDRKNRKWYCEDGRYVFAEKCYDEYDRNYEIAYYMYRPPGIILERIWWN